jgi:hypothetical protein
MLPANLARWLGALSVFAVLLLLAMSTNLRAATEALQVLAAGSSVQPAVQAVMTLPRGASVLVTGGAGFVGFHLCMRLKRDGVRVVAYAVSCSKLRPFGRGAEWCSFALREGSTTSIRTTRQPSSAHARPCCKRKGSR